MDTTSRLSSFVFLCLFGLASTTQGGIIQVGDLNIIDDAGNPSDGLRFLDMTFSDGLSQAAALANAQATYSNARLATQSEWDNLFDAAGISYDSSLTASSAFAAGATATISSGSNYDAGLRSALGPTFGNTFIFSDPDGSTGGTRDLLVLTPTDASASQSTAFPPNDAVGWLIADFRNALIQ